jgi:hypothetical protein
MLPRHFSVWLLLLALMFAPAVQAQNEPLTAPEADAIQRAVSEFYRMAQGGTNYWKMDTRLVSEELNALLQLAKAVERRSACEIEASDYPTDKPQLLEGAALTPYYEGYSAVLAIENIRKTGDTCRADVKLVYDREQLRHVWTNTAVVVWEEGRWKVDDILFLQNETGVDGSVKKMLRDFASVGQ